MLQIFCRANSILLVESKITIIKLGVVSMKFFRDVLSSTLKARTKRTGGGKDKNLIGQKCFFN